MLTPPPPIHFILASGISGFLFYHLFHPQHCRSQSHIQTNKLFYWRSTESLTPGMELNCKLVQTLGTCKVLVIWYMFGCFTFEELPLQCTGTSVCKVFSLETLLFTQAFCEGHSSGSPCHFAECQQAFTVTILMPGRKVMPLLSSKTAPGLLVALHLKVSTLSLLLLLLLSSLSSV